MAVQRTAVSVFAPGDPPLALTHVPLMQVPHGCVNVHGHIHNQASPTRHRHINVTVEHLRYRPARLSDIRRLARRLLEGRDVPGRNTDGTPGSGWTSLPLRCLERAATPQRRTMASMKSSIVQFDRCTTDRIESSHASAAPRVAVLKRDRKPSAAVPARVVRRSPKQSAHRLCTEYGTPMPSPMPSAKNYGPDTTMRGLRPELHVFAGHTDRTWRRLPAIPPWVVRSPATAGVDVGSASGPAPTRSRPQPSPGGRRRNGPPSDAGSRTPEARSPPPASGMGVALLHRRFSGHFAGVSPRSSPVRRHFRGGQRQATPAHTPVRVTCRAGSHRTVVCLLRPLPLDIRAAF